MDVKKLSVPTNTVTRTVRQLDKPTGNIYETVVIISQRADQISSDIKKELSQKLAEFSYTTDNLEETFENREQIEVSRHYERLPKPSLIATEEFLAGDIKYRAKAEEEA